MKGTHQDSYDLRCSTLLHWYDSKVDSLCLALRIDVMSLSVNCVFQQNYHKTHAQYMVFRQKTRSEVCNLPKVTSHLMQKLDSACVSQRKGSILLPWSIIAIVRDSVKTKSLGLFILENGKVTLETVSRGTEPVVEVSMHLLL